MGFVDNDRNGTAFAETEVITIIHFLEFESGVRNERAGTKPLSCPCISLKCMRKKVM